MIDKELFETKTIPHEDIEKVRDAGKEDVEDGIYGTLTQELENMDKGLLALGCQTGTGKSYSTLKYFADNLDEDTTFVMYSSKQTLLKQHKEQLMEFGVPEENIIRIKGFKRISELYPAEEDEDGKLVRKFEDVYYDNGEVKIIEKEEYDLTEQERNVVKDMYLGVSPHKIKSKYLDEANGEWLKQWDKNWKGKIVLAPVSYLTKECLDDPKDMAEVVATDEKVKSKEKKRWRFDKEEMEDFFDHMFDNYSDELETALEKIEKGAREDADIGEDEDVKIYSVNLTETGVKDLKNMVYVEEGDWAEEGFIGWARDLDQQIKRNSIAFKEDFDDMTRREDRNDRGNNFVRTIDSLHNSGSNLMLDNAGKVKFLGRVFKTARSIIYRKGKPGEYRTLFTKWPDFEGKLEFSEIIQHEEIKLIESYQEWGAERRKTKNFKEEKKVNSSEYGNTFLRDLNEAETGFVNGNSYRREDDELRVFDYQKAVYELPLILKLFDVVDEKPVLALNASFKPGFVEINMPKYGNYRVRTELTPESWKYWKDDTWEGRKHEMTELDKFIHNNCQGLSPYVPDGETEYLAEDLDLGGDIPFKLVETRVKNKNVKVIRGKAPRARNDRPGRTPKRGRLIKQLEEGKMPAFMRILLKNKENTALITHKDAIEGLRKNYDFVTKENSAYYHNLRGLNKLKDMNLIIVGTPMVNLDTFRDDAEYYGFDREEVLNPEKVDDGRYVYTENEHLQQFYEMHSEDIIAQAIGRARALEDGYDGEIYNIGIVPPQVKEQFSTRIENWDKWVVNLIIEKNGGIDRLLECFKDKGKLYVSELMDGVEQNEDIQMKHYLGALEKIEEAYDDNLVIERTDNNPHIRQDKRKGSSYDKMKELRKFVESGEGEYTTTEFKEKVVAETDVPTTGDIEVSDLEDLENEGVIERTEKRGFHAREKKIRF